MEEVLEICGEPNEWLTEYRVKAFQHEFALIIMISLWFKLLNMISFKGEF